MIVFSLFVFIFLVWFLCFLHLLFSFFGPLSPPVSPPCQQQLISSPPSHVSSFILHSLCYFFFIFHCQFKNIFQPPSSFPIINAFYAFSPFLSMSRLSSCIHFLRLSYFLSHFTNTFSPSAITLFTLNLHPPLLLYQLQFLFALLLMDVTSSPSKPPSSHSPMSLSIPKGPPHLHYPPLHLHHHSQLKLHFHTSPR